jgi:PAS domain S-box-containing protein
VADDAPRVFCVADDPALLSLLERAFERRSGAVAVTAASGGEALRVLSVATVHCIVSTQSAGARSGLELLDAVRESRVELPFVLFVGDGSERLASEALGRGATDYLRRSGTNPFELLVDRAVGYARRHRERAALERVRERYELAGRSVSDVVWEHDLSDGAVRWGAGVAETLGHDRDGEYDRDWWLERVHPRDRETVRAAWEAVAAGERERFECRYRFRRADGSYAQVVDGGEAVHEDGAAVRLVGALRDVSERLAWTAELERRNEQLDEFATVVSHDLRNPLNVARGRVELGRETGDLDHLDDAVDALDRMSDLIEDLLALARKGRAVDEPEPIALDGVAEAAWDTVPTPEGTDARLVLEAHGPVLADPDRLKQLLENLFGNAVEHGAMGCGTGPGADDDTDDESTLTVRVGRIDDEGFYVADDGPGIPTDECETVFDLGYTDAETGDGVGLAIVDEIATAHGWTVRATESDAGGARFEICGVSLLGSGDGGGNDGRADGESDSGDDRESEGAQQPADGPPS